MAPSTPRGPLNRELDLVPSPAAVYQVAEATTARDFAAVLFRRQRIISFVFLCIFGLVVGAAWLYPRLSPPRYSAGISFIPDGGLTPPEVLSEIELLKGSEMLESLAQEARVPLERLRRDLVAEPVMAGGIITSLIAVRYSSAHRAEVGRVLQRLRELYGEKHRSANRRPAALEYFQLREREFEQELRQAERQLADLQKKQPPLGGDGEQQQLRQKLASIEKERLATQSALHDADGRTLELARQLSALPEMVRSAIRAEEPAHLQRTKAELSDLQAQRARATFYRDIVKLDSRIRELRQAIASEAPPASPESVPNPLRITAEGELLRSQTILAGLRARLATLSDEERSSRKHLSASRKIAAGNSELAAELARKVKAADESYRFYRKKRAEAEETENMDRKGVPTLSLVENPHPPAAGGRRDLWFYALFGLVLATAGGAAAGLAAERLDHSVHDPGQLENCSSLLVLACIPVSDHSG